MPEESEGQGLRTFIPILVALALISFLTTVVPIGPEMLKPCQAAVAILFIALPILGLFRAADYGWTPARAGILIGVGVGIHLACYMLTHLVWHEGLLAAIASSIEQTGLVIWCAGLGAFVATILKEKNIILPVAVTLAAFDMFLVLTPVGFTQKLMKTNPELLHNIGFKVATVQSNPTLGAVAPIAYVGPADLLFMAMFFVALYRFKMRPKQTFLVLVPTLVLYLVIVFFVGPLPALVPIGLCVLIVNWKEFNLTKEEWASTGVVAALGAALVIWGATRPRPQVELSPPAPGQGAPGSSHSRGPGDQSRRR